MRRPFLWALFILALTTVSLRWPGWPSAPYHWWQHWRAHR